MKWLFGFIGLCVVAVALAILARYNHGYVLITYAPYRIEFSLNFLIVLVLVGFLIFHLLLRIAVITLHLPEKIRSYRLHKARNLARSAMHDSLMAYFEGKYSAAEKAAANAFNLNEWPTIASVIAAKSAHELRKFEQRDNYLSLIKETDTEGKLIQHMAQAEFLLKQGRAADALNVLEKVKRVAPKSVSALRLMLKAHVLEKNWEQILELVNRLKKTNGVDPLYAEEISRTAYIGLLSNKSKELNALKAVWQKIPLNLRLSPTVSLTAAKYFLSHQATENAISTIEYALQHQWDSALVELYGSCIASNALPQIEKAEAWLEEHPEDAMLLKALGRLCAQQSLWGKARSYFEASLAVEATQATHIAFAQLLEALGHQEEALLHYRESLTLDRRNWDISEELGHQVAFFANASAEKVKASE